MSKNIGQEKGLVTIAKVSIDAIELWNELTNGSRSSNSSPKVDVTLVVQKLGHKKNHRQKGFGAMG
jgi:hypothetical protein